MKYWHVETSQGFDSREESQRVLGHIGAPLEEVAIADKPALNLNQTAALNDAPELVDGTWTLDWTVTTGAATAEMIKAEAYRRIVAILPEWRQRNLLAQASILAEKGRSSWTDDELAAWNAGAAQWAQIAAIRAASDDIEAMSPIPTDYTDNSYWP